MAELRISCRMVCTDQWLVTHVDPSWPISQLKLVLLQKFSRERCEAEKNQREIHVSPRKTRRRSLSPITFAAPPRKSQPAITERSAFTASTEGSEPEELGLVASADDEDDDDGVDDDDGIVDVNKALAEAHRYKYNTRPSTSSASDSLARLLSADSSGVVQEADLCVLITFSTTQILEDRFSLEWYGIHPDELLELHPLSHSFVSLPRFSLDAYIAPYFAARVWALRAVGAALDSTLKDFGIPRDHQTDDEIPDVTPRSPLLREKTKKKLTLEWKERWAVIHQGVFSLCKERHDIHTAFSAPLTSMLAIRDSTQFDLPLRSSRRTRSIPTTSASDVVCVKFVDPAPPRRQRTMSHESYATQFEPQPPEPISPTQGAWWRRGSREVSTTLSSSLASSASALMGSPSGSGLAEMWDALARRGSRTGLEDPEGEGDDAVWIVLDMLTSAACSHILRILHRHAPATCDSSFLPTLPPSRSAPSPIVFNTRTSSPISPSFSTSDLPTPGPSSSYSFPPLSPPLASPSMSCPIPSSPRVSAPPTRPISPLRPPPLRIDTSATEHGVSYPDWRLALVRKGRRAGLGAVGRAMELVMFGEEEDEDDEDEDDELAIEWARRLSAMTASPVDYPLGSHSRPRPERHLSDSAVPSAAECMYTPMGEFDAPEPHESDDSMESEAEWESWLDVVMGQRRREQLALRSLPRSDALDTSVPQELYWGISDWDAQGMSTGTPSPAASTPEHERADPWPREQSGSEADDGSSMQSAERSHYARPPLPPIPSSARGRRAKARGAATDHGSGGGRTLSSYASAESLLKRTIRTAVGGAAKAQVQAKRASVSNAELKLYEAALANPPLPPPRSSSASPPLSRPSMTSLRSIGSSRSRPQSPLCAQVQDSDANVVQRAARYDTRQHHPIPLPGMPMVPSGYTTFRHSSLYGRRSGGRSSSGPAISAEGSERESEEHAGLAHGQSMQRLPVPMTMMMTTVSSTVSVGHDKARAGATSR